MHTVGPVLHVSFGLIGKEVDPGSLKIEYLLITIDLQYIDSFLPHGIQVGREEHTCSNSNADGF